MTVAELFQILKKHEGFDSPSYFDAETGWIEGIFDLEALAKELSANEVPADR
jgi:hypothetical protein